MSQTTATFVAPPVNRRFWKCAVCGRTLGEITAEKLIVKVGERIIRLPLIAGTEQICPRCGGENRLEAA